MANRNDVLIGIDMGRGVTFDDILKAYIRLRDAAPELLIALKIARTRLAWFVEHRGGDEGDQAALLQIDAAIMKAEDEASD
jgi:hypothetical protein